MTSINQIAADLASLSISRCVGENKNPALCPHRVVANGTADRASEKKPTRRMCRRCEDSCARILGFVAERVSAIMYKSYPSLSEDIAADVVAEYVTRIENGKLLRNWDPTKPAWSIASKAFLKNRISSAAAVYRRQRVGEKSLTKWTAAKVSVKQLDIVHLVEPELQLHEQPISHLLRPQCWKGAASEVVAAVQLFPLLSKEINSNGILVAKLAKVCRSSDPISLLERYHSMKDQERAEEIEELSAAVRKSRKSTTQSAFEDELETGRLETVLTPLAAPDLQVLLHLKQAAANKRMGRYRKLLKQRLEPLLASLRGGRSGYTRAGPAASPAAMHVYGGDTKGGQGGVSDSRSFIMRSEPRISGRTTGPIISDCGFIMKCTNEDQSRTCSFCFRVGARGVRVRVDEALHADLCGMRVGCFPAMKIVGKRGWWRFAEPVTHQGARQFASSDLVLSMRDGTRLRLPRPLEALRAASASHPQQP